jgi:tetrahydromethanopterin S-methyltransferase subunit A
MLVENGVDERKRIVGAQARTPYLFNLPIEYIARFRQQVRIIDLVDKGDPELLRRAVWSCFQEEPTSFQNYTLSDPGAYIETPLSGQFTWRVTRPQAEPKDEAEREQREKLRALMARVKQGAEKKRARERL